MSATIKLSSMDSVCLLRYICQTKTGKSLSPPSALLQLASTSATTMANAAGVKSSSSVPQSSTTSLLKPAIALVRVRSIKSVLSFHFVQTSLASSSDVAKNLLTNKLTSLFSAILKKVFTCRCTCTVFA